MHRPSVASLSSAELADRLEGGATPFMLDVREVEEMADGRVPGSVNIPMGEVERRLSEIPADRDVVVICHLGGRSARVTQWLNAMGYDRAINLAGGVDGWLAEARKRQ